METWIDFIRVCLFVPCALIAIITKKIGKIKLDKVWPVPYLVYMETLAQTIKGKVATMQTNFDKIQAQAVADMNDDNESSTNPVYDTYTGSQLSMIAIMPINGLRHRLISRMSPNQVHDLNLMIAANPDSKIAPTKDGQALSMLAVSIITEPMPDKVAKKIDNFLHDGSVDLPNESNFDNRVHLIHANRRPRTTIK